MDSDRSKKLEKRKKKKPKNRKTKTIKHPYYETTEDRQDDSRLPDVFKTGDATTKEEAIQNIINNFKQKKSKEFELLAYETTLEDTCSAFYTYIKTEDNKYSILCYCGIKYHERECSYLMPFCDHCNCNGFYSWEHIVPKIYICKPAKYKLYDKQIQTIDEDDPWTWREEMTKYYESLDCCSICNDSYNEKLKFLDVCI